MISDSFKQDLLNRVDIVDVIERYVTLKKSGTNLSACCPFHSEKTPSFTVSPTKQFYHCFGCGAHGNAISFVMEYQGLGYVEAVRDLAEGVGMKLPEFQPQQHKKNDSGPDLYEVMERAAQFYREELRASPRAIEYLKGRGLTGEVAKRFGIGYAPQGWQALEKVFSSYKDKSLADAGLVVEKDDGKRYDRFRDRIMFPILNQRGSVIGFGGRVIDPEDAPKYLNSPETPLFQKGQELYGWSQARMPIREAGRALVVEGYMDVVALAQHGIGYAVATLGTATSATHVSKLLRQTDEVVFSFDGDAAGRRAAWHALEVALPLTADQKTLRFLFLPPEDDPDSFVRAHGKEAFEARVRQATPLSEFLLTELKSHVDLSTIEGRAKLMHEAKPMLQKIAAPMVQRQLLKQIAGLSDMSVDEAAQLCGIAHAKAAPKTAPSASRAGFTTPQAAWQRHAGQRTHDTGKAAFMPNRRLQRSFLRHVMQVPELAEKVPDEMLEGDTADSRLLAQIVRLVESEGIKIAAELRGLEPEGEEEDALLRTLSEEAIGGGITDADVRAEFEAALLMIEEDRLNEQIRVLRDKQELSPEDGQALQQLLNAQRQVRQLRSTPLSMVKSQVPPGP